MQRIRLTLWIFCLENFSFGSKGVTGKLSMVTQMSPNSPTSVTFCSETEMRFLNLGKIIFLCLRSISWNWYIYTSKQTKEIEFLTLLMKENHQQIEQNSIICDLDIFACYIFQNLLFPFVVDARLHPSWYMSSVCQS